MLLASDDAPLPLSATFRVATRQVVVTFDGPLAPPVLDPNNWKLDRLGNEYAPTGPPVVAGDTVTWTAAGLGGIGPPGSNVRYAATPPDLTGITGTPVAAFTLPYIDI